MDDLYYRKLLSDIMATSRNNDSLEYAIEQAHKVVVAKRNFLKAMDNANNMLNNERIMNGH